MSKIFTSYLIAGTLLISFLLAPQSIFAAELIFKNIPNTETTDRTIVIEVRIDPQSKTLNVVEGEIKFSGLASNGLFVQVENGQSVLPIWPTAPVYDADKKSIIFTGGVPNGFNVEGLLFRLHFSPASSGKLNISYEGNAYLNDGKGTKEDVSSKYLEININKNGYDKKTSNFVIPKYVIITLLAIAVFVFIYKYVFKKKNKQ